MRESNPRFTVIIPTKNRADFLYHTLRTCTQQDYDNLEIVVADDGSTDHTREVVEAATRGDSRVRYTNPGARTGMLENFEFAVDQAKPGYVIALGGDDALLPYGVSRMRDTLLETGQELLCWPTPIYFYAKTRMPMAQLILHTTGRRPRTGVRTISSASFLERQTRELRYVTDVEAPMFYVKGVTSTALVERVRSRSRDGRFYSCATPDGYSAIVLAGEVSSYAFSGKPFSLFGISPNSAGYAYLSASAEAKKQSDAFFQLSQQRPMHRDLGSMPYSPLICLMTADYLLTARDLPGWPGKFPQLDFRHVLVKGIEEVQDGLFAADRIPRELSILYGIAQHHGLGEFFRQRVRDSHRNVRVPLEGNAFGPTRLYLDATELGIENVFDAAYFAYYAHETSESWSLSVFRKAMMNSARYRMMSMRSRGSLPPEAEWLKAPEAAR